MKVEDIKIALKKNQEVKVEFGVLQDLIVLYEKAVIQVKEAKDMQKILKANLSDALIILEQNIPAQADNAIKKAIELDADEVVAKFNILKKKARDLAQDIMPTYKSI